MKYDLMNYDAQCKRCQTANSSCSEAIVRTVDGIKMEFDVSCALRRCIQKTPVDLPHELRDLFLSVGGFDEPHIWHVNHEYPGIVAALEDGLFLIDGHHRAERCRRIEKPFRVYLFTEEEAKLFAMPVVLTGE